MIQFRRFFWKTKIELKLTTQILKLFERGCNKMRKLFLVLFLSCCYAHLYSHIRRTLESMCCQRAVFAFMWRSEKIRRRKATKMSNEDAATYNNGWKFHLNTVLSQLREVYFVRAGHSRAMCSIPEVRWKETNPLFHSLAFYAITDLTSCLQSHKNVERMKD